MNNLDFLSPELYKLFQEYIELDTSSLSGENYPRAINLLEDFLVKQGFQTEQILIPESVIHKPNRVHLIARKFLDEQLPTLLIYSHIDVVPANYTDAFTFQVKENRVFGRGSADQKGGTVAVFAALEQLKNVPLKYNLIFWATTDEETDQLAQLRWITPKLRLPKNTIVFDPDTDSGGITIGYLGLLQLEVTVRGKSVHSGMSHMGINAIDQAAQLVTTFFKQIKLEYENQISQIKPFPSPNLDSMCSRCNVNMIHGGIVANVVPDTCNLIVDCRYIPEANIDREKEHLLKRLLQFCDEHGISYELKINQLIYGHAEDHPLIHHLNDLYTHIAGKSGLYGAMGSTPLAHWTYEQKLPHLGLGVIGVDSNIHGDNESAEINDIFYLAETLKLLIT